MRVEASLAYLLVEGRQQLLEPSLAGLSIENPHEGEPDHAHLVPARVALLCLLVPASHRRQRLTDLRFGLHRDLLSRAHVASVTATCRCFHSSFHIRARA